VTRPTLEDIYLELTAEAAETTQTPTEAAPEGVHG
jgi:hypothetical protein